MIVKDFIGKQLDVDRLKHDIIARELVGAHYHPKGKAEKEFEILEMVIFPGGEYTYAFKVYLKEAVISKIERVKFQWECGGWRSEDTVLKRFPVGLNVNEPFASEVLSKYLIGSGA